MNIMFDYKFGNFIIPRTFVVYASKYFYAMAPPNQILKGRNLSLFIFTY